MTVLVLAGRVEAADGSGQFAIKGGGQQTCAAFLKAWKERTSDMSLYAGWIDGYTTGLNQVTADTYDLASWQSTETLLGLSQAICAKAPEGTRFMDAFYQVVRLLTPSRLSAQSPLVALVHDERSVVAYATVVRRMKSRLRELGHGTNLKDDEIFDNETSAAIAAFQAAEGLPAVGLPDQHTLFQLFRTR